MKIIESLLTKNPCYTAGEKIIVKGLILHSVGCPQPDAKVFVKNWNKTSYNRACVHAFIDGNTGDIYQTLPWNHRGWHAGGSGNDTHIGVEMCEPGCIKYTKGVSFTCSDLEEAKAVAKRTYEAAVELFAHLCAEFALDPTADGVIVSHKEGHARGITSNHGDPEHLWKGLGLPYTMNTFRQAVKASMGIKEPAKKPSTPKAKFAKGDKVKVKKAVTYEGKSFKAYYDVYDVIDVKGDRVVIGIGKIVTAAVKATNLTKTDAEPVKKEVKVGCTVRLREGAKTFNGGNLASFVYDRDHQVKEINVDRVVITYKGIVVAAVRKSDLIVID